MSHGWCSLSPFYLDQSQRRLHRILRLNERAVSVEMMDTGEGAVRLNVQSKQRLNTGEVKTLREQIASVLRLDESLTEFYCALAGAADSGKYEWIPKVRAGRLLRGPDVFEDVVKMMCTTNCAWSATERMVENLVQKLGTRFDQTRAAFPTPQELAAAGHGFLVKEIRTGYRSAYLLEFAENTASGRIDFNRWTGLMEEELFKELQSIKGIGPYAAGNLLRLLGHYRHLALDSWCRPRFSELYRSGRKVSDKTIARHYRAYGKWSGLVMWLDLTRDWFDGKQEERPF